MLDRYRDPTKVVFPVFVPTPQAVPMKFLQEAPEAPGPGHTAHVLILHAVADYGAWKRVFDSAATMRKEAGELSYRVLRDREDANSVVHFSAWTTHDDAMRFFGSPELEEIRRKAGVTAPTFHYLHLLECGVLQQSPGPVPVEEPGE